jgi:predicted house-cleaning noncanonical NTP pyrophosphatase (MazG superfamily)
MKKIIKLVRDRIPQIIEKGHLKATFYIADEDEYRYRLRNKLQEEVDEYLADTTIEELADIMEVVYALAQVHGISVDQLEAVRKKKAQERGAFQKRLVIEYEK